MKTMLVIGLGEFGTHVSVKLGEMGCEVMAVDIDEERVNYILPYVTNAQIGDATNEDFLRSLGVDEYDICIVALGGHFQSSLETTCLLDELGAKKILSRATNDVQMKFLLKNGADEVVYPEKQMALRTATICASDGVLDFVRLDKDHSIFEIDIPTGWAGKNLMQIDSRRKYNINVLSVKREGSVFIPTAETVLRDDDTAYVISRNEDIRKIVNM